MKNKSFFQFHTLKAKLITVSVLLLSIPLIIVGLISYNQSSLSLDELGETNLQNSVKMTIQMIGNLNEEVENGNLSLEVAQEYVREFMLGEKNADGTRPLNTNIDLGENGYMIAYSQDGIELAHPSLEGKNVWDVEDSNGEKFVQEAITVGNNGGGFTYYDWPLPNAENVIEEKVSYSETDPYWGWVLNASTYMSDFNKPASDLLSIITIASVIAIILGTIIIWLFANRLTKPIKLVTERMKSLAGGDLTGESILVNSKDETGQLSISLNQMQNSLRDIIQKVAQSSELISSHSEELTQSANEVKAGSEQVATTMQELASGSEKQADNSSELSGLMERFVNNIQETSNNGGQIEESSKLVLDLTVEGGQLMGSSTEQMAKIDHIVKDSVEKVQGLDEQVKEISKLVDVIKGVADQTNLLALNAAIEAARAGEHGRGFSVVADEVRKLAEQVGFSVKDITGIVENIQKDFTNVTDSLKGGYQEVEAGTEKITVTRETFDRISNAVTEVVDNIKQATNHLSEIVEESQTMNSSIQEIAAISEESAAGVEQTSAATQQTNSAMEEVAGSSAQLAELAEKLNNLLSHFKL